MGQAWFLYALSTSILWGLSYALSEKVLKSGFPITLFACVTACVVLLVYGGFSLYSGGLKTGFNIVQNDPKIGYCVAFIAVLNTVATLFIYKAISLENASLVNLIEISYPVFTVFFAWFLFKDIQISWSHALGGLMIFAGITLIFLKS